jgi:c-di-GMP-binding flagellar brake protein YcgR
MRPDRRRFLRVKADLGMECATISAGGSRGAPFAARTGDVSAGGAKLTASRPLVVGERLSVELAFDRPGLVLLCEAEVVRVEDDPHTGALRFHGVDEYIEQGIVRWVYAEDRRISDRRAQARIPARIRVVCRTSRAEAGQFAAPSLDISGDGVRILAKRVLQPGERLELELCFDDGMPPFCCPATVVWSGEAGSRTAHGLQFDALSPAQRRRLIDRCVDAEKRQRQ